MRFSESTQNPALKIFSSLLSTCNRNTYTKINQYFVVSVLFLNERDHAVVIEQTRFLITVFLCREFMLENIYSEVNFCGKNICSKFIFFMRELIFVDRWKNRKNRKTFVPRGIDQLILEEKIENNLR